MDNVVEIKNLTRRYRRKTALDDVTLSVARGSVVGIVGDNGAGKTTLLKHMMGLLRAQEGTVRIFDLDPVKHPTVVLARIGYLSENRDLPDWMHIDEMLRYLRAFYPTWDHDYATTLVKNFGLGAGDKIRNLSRGERVKAGLIAALAHRPELLVLDEASSGLDPAMRQDVLTAIIRSVAETGRTVIFATHLIEEVERIADRAVFIMNGKIVIDDTLDAIRDSHCRLTLRSPSGKELLAALPGHILSEQDGEEWSVVCHAPEADAIAAAKQAGLEVLDSAVLPLEEIFITRSRAQVKPAKLWF